MSGHKFDISKLERLNDPARFEQLDPARMWQALGSPSPITVVEVGAGTGMFAEQFARLAVTAEVIAVDEEPAMVEWMESHRVAPLGGRLTAVLGSAESLPLTEARTDIVVMINLHHELDDALRAYAEAHRVLRSGGQLLVVDWAQRETPKGPPLAVRVSEDDLIALLKDVGFDYVEAHATLPWHTMITARA